MSSLHAPSRFHSSPVPDGADTVRSIVVRPSALRVGLVSRLAVALVIVAAIWILIGRVLG